MNSYRIARIHDARESRTRYRVVTGIDAQSRSASTARASKEELRRTGTVAAPIGMRDQQRREL